MISRTALLLTLAGLCSWPSWAATLTVNVEGVSPRGGNLRLALYNRDSYAGHEADPLADKVVAAIAPETIVRFDNLAPGTYAIKAFQDVNRNGEFDMNWIGLPQEPFGFSNDARPLFDQPPFRATSFTIGNGERTLTIRLRHWFSGR